MHDSAYKKKRAFKDLPLEWKNVKLGELLSFVGSGITPKGGSEVYRTEGIPFIRSQNVYPQGLRLDDVVYIPLDLHNGKMKRTQVQERDVLLNITGASIGRCTFVNVGLGEANVNQHVCILRSEEETLHYRFLTYILNSNIGQRQIFGEQAGQTREGLNFQQIREFEIPVPTLAEQRKISDILTSVDNAISKTESIIEQTEKVKKGLLQQLFTKGIGHTKFKQTEIGEIPEEWEIRSIRELGDLRSGSTPDRKNLQFFDNGKIPWVKTLDLNNSTINTTQENITESAIASTSCKIVPKGSVLVAMYGGFNQIGRTGLLGIEAAFNQALTAIVADPTQITGEYLQEWLNFRVDWWKNFAASSRKDPNITKNDVRNFLVAVPPLNEQVKIVEVIQSIFHKIAIEKKKFLRLKILKKSLMQVLLTGVVRVKVDDQEAVTT